MAGEHSTIEPSMLVNMQHKFYLNTKYLQRERDKNVSNRNDYINTIPTIGHWKIWVFPYDLRVNRAL